MIVIPVYNMILLPEITFYFKKDLFESLNLTGVEPGEDVLFVMQKEEKERAELTADDFYPVGVSGVVEKPDEEGFHVKGSRGACRIFAGSRLYAGAGAGFLPYAVYDLDLHVLHRT